MSRPKLIVSIDVERDIPRFLQNQYGGVEVALDVCLEKIRSCGFVADLFVEEHVARRFPKLLNTMRNRGHYIGYHGDHMDPQYATQLGPREFESQLRGGLETLRHLSGQSPLAFRGANFAVSHHVFESLDRLGFRVDSSVLPNRHVRRWFAGTLVDHRGLPSHPYLIRPEASTTSRSLLEIPITENPLNPGNPIGTGYLNWRGVDETWRALRSAKGDPITFLIHPWECIDLGAKHPELPRWVKGISRENARELGDLMTRASAMFEPATLPGIAREQGVEVG